ncbi:hypothetical protein ACFLW8_03380 [Chloroflexota bacterium]
MGASTPIAKGKPTKYRACQREFSGCPMSILRATGWIFNLSGGKGVKNMISQVIRGRLTYIDTDTGDIEINTIDGESMDLNAKPRLGATRLLNMVKFMGEDVEVIVSNDEVKDICPIE